jgi:hypothetical protein
VARKTKTSKRDLDKLVRAILDGKRGDQPYVIGGNECSMVVFPRVGTVFLSWVDDVSVVEAIALAEPGDSREVIDARRAKLEWHLRKSLGDATVDEAKRRAETPS